MKRTVEVVCLTLSLMSTSVAADMVDPVTSFIIEHGDRDFAPSEVRTLNVEVDGHEFSLMLDGESLTVTTKINDCAHFNTPLTIFANDQDGDRKVDSVVYSMAKWKCGEEASYLTSLPLSVSQTAFNDGVAAVKEVIDAK